MNIDNKANDANDDGEELYVGLPETERQELLRQRREIAREIQIAASRARSVAFRATMTTVAIGTTTSAQRAG